MQSKYKTKWKLFCLFLLCFVFLSNNFAQPSSILKKIGQTQIEFDNGNYQKAIEIAEFELEKARRNKDKSLISKCLSIKAVSQISLQNYPEAEKTLDEASQNLSDSKTDAIQRAQIYLNFALLYRTQQKFSKALDYSKKAILLVPENRHILAEHYLNFGRILFTSGYDISAIIWLEKASKLLETEKTNSAKLDVDRFLVLAWWAKLNYQTALKYSDKLQSESLNTQFKYKYRQSLFESSSILSEAGQKRAAFQAMENGLDLALRENNSHQAGVFLTSLLLNSLDNYEIKNASNYLSLLKKLNEDEFSFEILLGEAVICAYTNKSKESEDIFSQLNKMDVSSEFTLPGWKLKIAKRNNDWKQILEINQKLLDLTIENNF